MRFVLFFVNDGFHLGSTSMEHDFEEICIHQKITLRLFSSLLFPSISLTLDAFCHSLLPL